MYRLRDRRALYLLAALLTLLTLSARLLSLEPTVVFIVSAGAMAMLAWLIGVATENLGAATGPKVSGVLNASFGNIAELVITVFALRAGLGTVVKASITGSILGNALFVLGLSLLVAGLRHGELRFSRVVASLHSSLLSIAIVGLLVPAVFAQSIGPGHGQTVEHLSIGVSVILLATYALSLVYFFQTPEMAGRERSDVVAAWSARRSAIVLALTGVAITLVSDVLVDALRPALLSFHINQVFAGIVIIPLIGNISENVVCVQLALQNDMDFSMVVSLGASLQIALFVAPVLVLLSLVMGSPLTLIFTPTELVTLGLAVLIVRMIAADGESHWMEGAELVAVYMVVALTFFFYPG